MRVVKTIPFQSLPLRVGSVIGGGNVETKVLRITALNCFSLITPNPPQAVPLPLGGKALIRIKRYNRTFFNCHSGAYAVCDRIPPYSSPLLKGETARATLPRGISYFPKRLPTLPSCLRQATFPCTGTALNGSFYGSSKPLPYGLLYFAFRRGGVLPAR